MSNTFVTPEGHSGFLAKQLFDWRQEGRLGELEWGALAYIEKDGGGPAGDHTHESGHVFIVVEGEARVMVDGTAHRVKEDECFYVGSMAPHSIWNDGAETAKVIKLNVKRG